MTSIHPKPRKRRKARSKLWIAHTLWEAKVAQTMYVLYIWLASLSICMPFISTADLEEIFDIWITLDQRSQLRERSCRLLNSSFSSYSLFSCYPSCICRNSSRTLIDRFARSVLVSSAAQAEALELLETLKNFVSRKHEPLLLESSSVELISTLQNTNQFTW